jgi:hypothetical protein
MKNKARKAYIRGLKKAQKIIAKEYALQKVEQPDNLDGFTFGWLSQSIISHCNKLKGKKRK